MQDPGQSGASPERPGMDRVSDLVAARVITFVLAQDRDRLARKPAYHYLLHREFEEYSCKMRSLNDRGDDSPKGELTDGIPDQLAKFERAKTTERTRRSKLQKAREDKMLAVHGPPYGFRYNEGTKAISLVLVSRNAGDVHVYRHGRWSVAISAAGGLKALEFVQCFVEAALYAGLVTGELGEGVRAVAVPYEAQTEHRRVRIPHISVGFPNEYACLHPPQPPKPPVGGDDPIDEEVLQLSDRLKLGPQVFVQLPQRLLVLSRQQNLLGAQAVPERI